MPLQIFIKERELYDPKRNRFITIKPQKLILEHSLISLSKWEAKWHKAYLSREEKTEEESVDYIRCMCLSQNFDPNVVYGIDKENIKLITDYIQDPMTATTIHERDKHPSREIITNELIYFWMTEFNIPFDPCEKWHLNRLMTLIRVASIKSQPGKKMSSKELMSRNALLNAQRRAKYGTRG